jgi:hypothetical protein
MFTIRPPRLAGALLAVVLPFAVHGAAAGPAPQQPPVVAEAPLRAHLA